MANPIKAKIQCDLNPHAEAVAARWLYHDDYATQRTGQMGFYDGLAKPQKRLVKEMVDNILAAPLGRAPRVR